MRFFRNSPYVPKGLTLNLANPAQLVLFNEELAGQISDGVWENSRPFEHWTWVPRRDNTSCGDIKPLGLFYDTTYGGELHKGVRFTPPRRYNFCNSLLVEVCGERMIAEVQTRLKGYHWYNMKALKADLRHISEIVNGPKR